MYGTLTNMTGSLMRGTRATRICTISLCATGLIGLLAACSSPTSSSTEQTPSPTASKKSKSASPSPTSASPTFTRKPTSSPTPTKPPSPLFVASLPDTVSATVGQRIVVQLPTEQGQRWTASGSGAVSVGGTKYIAPPASQPDAPGTSITNITAKKTGTAKVTFTASATNGAPSSTKKLTVNVK